MSRPLRIEFVGALYHVTSRGNARQNIYVDDEDRETFLRCLAYASEQHCWQCHAFCLMSNHHLLIETVEATLSKGMRALNGVYTQSYNRRHRRVGHLLQGRYKAVIVEKQAYLLELARYIVLNPVRAGLVDCAGAWPWSSYRATIGLSEAPDFLEVDWLLAQFGDERRVAREQYRSFVAAGGGQQSPWLAVKGQIYLGSDEFINRMQNQLHPDRPLNGVPKRQRRAPPLPLEHFAREFKLRDQAMAHAYRSGNYTLAQIGNFFAVSRTTVGRAVKALKG